MLRCGFIQERLSYFYCARRVRKIVKVFAFVTYQELVLYGVHEQHFRYAKVRGRFGAGFLPCFCDIPLCVVSGLGLLFQMIFSAWAVNIQHIYAHKDGQSLERSLLGGVSATSTIHFLISEVI